MKSKSPAELAKATKAIESLKKENLIEKKNYNLENEDDLAEIISSAWVNAGDNTDTILERLQVLEPVSIPHIIRTGNRLMDLSESINRDNEIEEVNKARSFIPTAKPVEPRNPAEYHTPNQTENAQYNAALKQYDAQLRKYNADQTTLKEHQETLAPYEQKRKNFEKMKKKFPELHEKIYKEIISKQPNEELTPKQVDSEKIKAIKDQIAILKSKEEALGREGLKQKQNILYFVTNRITLRRKKWKTGR